MKRTFTLFLFALALSFTSQAQTILNGDFEDNPFISDLINPAPGLLNAAMDGFYVFGEAPSVDMITSTEFGGGPFEGDWNLAIAGGGAETFSLEFDPPLVFGTEYMISYFEKSFEDFEPLPFIFAVSGGEDMPGDTIFTSTTTGEDGEWIGRMFTFTPEGNVTHLVVGLDGGTLENRSYIDKIYFGDATNTTEIEKEDFMMYPNPVSEELNFSQLPSNTSEIVIYNIAGQVVLNEIIGNTTSTMLSVAELATGSYVVEVRTDDSSSILRKRFQKN